MIVWALNGRQCSFHVIATALALFFTSATPADNWKETRTGSSVLPCFFPGDPAVETATCMAADGETLSAHVLSMK
jgi:hypothetical protein